MLVLSRKVGESIQIGNDVTVTVLNCNGNHIRIGITAPKAIPVHRQEVYMRNGGAEGGDFSSKGDSGRSL